MCALSLNPGPSAGSKATLASAPGLLSPRGSTHAPHFGSWATTGVTQLYCEALPRTPASPPRSPATPDATPNTPPLSPQWPRAHSPGLAHLTAPHAPSCYSRRRHHHPRTHPEALPPPRQRPPAQHGAQSVTIVSDLTPVVGPPSG